MNNQTQVKNIFKEDEPRLKEIIRMNNYPNQSGSVSFRLGVEEVYTVS